MSSSNRTTKRERQRCANIVAGHRQRVRLKVLAYRGDDVSYSKILTGVVEFLGRIEREILDLDTKGQPFPQDTPQYQGDFSAEEMERALRVMEEQDQRNNPFEVST